MPDQASWFPTLFEGINTRAVGRWRTEMARATSASSPRSRARSSRAGYPVDPGPSGDLTAEERWFRYQTS